MLLCNHQTIRSTFRGTGNEVWFSERSTYQLPGSWKGVGRRKKKKTRTNEERLREKRELSCRFSQILQLGVDPDLVFPCRLNPHSESTCLKCVARHTQSQSRMRVLRADTRPLSDACGFPTCCAGHICCDYKCCSGSCLVTSLSSFYTVHSYVWHWHVHHFFSPQSLLWLICLCFLQVWLMHVPSPVLIPSSAFAAAPFSIFQGSPRSCTSHRVSLFLL